MAGGGDRQDVMRLMNGKIDHPVTEKIKLLARIDGRGHNCKTAFFNLLVGQLPRQQPGHIVAKTDRFMINVPGLVYDLKVHLSTPVRPAGIWRDTGMWLK